MQPEKRITSLSENLPNHENISDAQLLSLLFGVGRRIHDAVIILVMEPGRKYTDREIVSLLQVISDTSKPQFDKRTVSSSLAALVATGSVEYSPTSAYEGYYTLVEDEARTMIVFATYLLQLYATLGFNPALVWGKHRSGYFRDMAPGKKSAEKWQEHAPTRLAILSVLNQYSETGVLVANELTAVNDQLEPPIERDELRAHNKFLSDAGVIELFLAEEFPDVQSELRDRRMVQLSEEYREKMRIYLSFLKNFQDVSRMREMEKRAQELLQEWSYDTTLLKKLLDKDILGGEAEVFEKPPSHSEEFRSVFLDILKKLSRSSDIHKTEGVPLVEIKAEFEKRNKIDLFNYFVATPHHWSEQQKRLLEGTRYGKIKRLERSSGRHHYLYVPLKKAKQHRMNSR